MLCSTRALSRSIRSAFSSTACSRVNAQPKPSLSLDPSLQSLLHDVDISLMPKRQGTEVPTLPAQELEAFENSDGEIEYHDVHHEDYPVDEPARRREDRKSPAARFGSDGMGSVVLSTELQHTITALIEGSNKTLLHSDAKRLFAGQDNSGESWSAAYDVEYKNRRQRYQHSARDATAFASVILPAHYSAIHAVLSHVKHRLGPSWSVDRVIDWGAATGSGLWAASHVFQKSSACSGKESLLADSTIVAYLGLDHREGLVSIAKQLLQKIKLGALSTTWRKSFHEEFRVEPAEGHSTIALSAFMLSAQPSSLSRKNMVKEMWESGAQTIILIDHSSSVGFQNIAEARHLLLDLGRKEAENPEFINHPCRGSHVVAPCPHDRPCPLQHPGPMGLVCGFSQRLQRPTFVRRTKHAKQGHEDIGYSYVVIRRGPRPNVTDSVESGPLMGRMGGVERETMRRATAGTGVLRELQRAREHRHDQTTMNPQSPSFSVSTAGSMLPHARSPLSADISTTAVAQAQVQAFVPVDNSVDTGDVEILGLVARYPSSQTSSTPQTSVPTFASTSRYPPGARYPEEAGPGSIHEEFESPSNLEEVLRSEAYGWPRLVFPPLKKSGHIIIDACTREGKIMRLTIPKSQGKQPFYDARKSSWGDIFPHPPKNNPIERFQLAEEGAAPMRQSMPDAKGSDVGKRSKGRDRKDKTHERSYAALDDMLRREQKARWKASRKDFACENGEALRLVESEAGNVHQY